MMTPTKPMNMATTIINIRRALPLVQQRHLSNANKTYIDRMGQSIHDKDLAFITGFIISSIVPYSIFIGSLSSVYTETRMLKTIDHMNTMVFDKQNDFVKQKFHTRYFLAHNGANGMFFGAIFFTMIGITTWAVDLKGAGFL